MVRSCFNLYKTGIWGFCILMLSMLSDTSLAQKYQTSADVDSARVIVVDKAMWRSAYCLIRGIDADYDRMIITEHGIPQVSVSRDGAVTTSFRDIPSSLIRSNYSKMWGNTEISVYPMISLDNYSFDRVYTYCFSLAPTVRTDIWPGAFLTMQMVFTVSDNLRDDSHQDIRPGYNTLTQMFRTGNQGYGRLTAGLFSDNRWGYSLNYSWYVPLLRLNLISEASIVGRQYFVKPKVKFYKLEEFAGYVGVDKFIRPLRLQLQVRYMRYLYDNEGVRVDMTRYFRDTAVGFYVIGSKDHFNMGFHFAIPLASRKSRRIGRVSLRTAEYFDWEYSMKSDGYFQDVFRSFETRPDENRSAHYFDPDYLMRR